MTRSTPAAALFLFISLVSTLAGSQDSMIKAPLSTSSEVSEPTAATLKRLHEIYGGAGGITYSAMKSAPGDTASGVIVEKTDNYIRIDTTPCLTQKRLVTFLKPYKESSIKEQKCEDKVYPRVQVIQIGWPK